MIFEEKTESLPSIKIKPKIKPKIKTKSEIIDEKKKSDVIAKIRKYSKKYIILVLMVHVVFYGGLSNAKHRILDSAKDSMNDSLLSFQKNKINFFIEVFFIALHKINNFINFFFLKKFT